MVTRLLTDEHLSVVASQERFQCTAAGGVQWAAVVWGQRRSIYNDLSQGHLNWWFSRTLHPTTGDFVEQ